MQYTNAVRKLMAGEPPMTSFSGNYEDVILARVFDGQENGFYVDIGAHHPMNGSNTHHFYMQGWSGINIEPAKSFTCFPQQRSKDVNLNIAISSCFLLCLKSVKINSWIYFRLALVICLFPGEPSNEITSKPTAFKVRLTIPFAQ